MKKRGMSQALIGLILGVIILLLLVALTIKLMPSAKRNDCANNVDWDNFKTKLSDAEKGIASTTFFKNGNCYLVSFSLENINSPSPEIKSPSEIKQKQKPAVCLCNLNGDECEVNNYFKDCYIFNELNDINPYNSGDNIREDKNYIFITIENKDSILEITDDIKNTEPVIQKSQQGITSPIFLPEQTDQIA